MGSDSVRYTCLRMEKSPKETRRYAFSSEARSKDRARTIQTVIEEVRRERPEILAFTLFGSLTKGTAQEDSDLDLNVYIDA
ncbi:hypothetical protein COU19_03020 [Candidatus Kaiserbacteria bacterium CG10_big_fil_rev_8_21_14_0_10_56_12]|uniref:Polymerase beta nucleotidyltransferase domain-containing protein n=1 Tax=Candidatus Kaiserbacteria bacterium CG10_big_fil_rev_8_21_14_0_10_56_12 TaxID=1974611 RepID=A0A2H0UB00_9BACT|nr:MAG: hypothetical protein COU19_03020 [Candidatus Kaiserbacteria bacterium CG10_big_fil_rev_8_21_14_0_10_56_12]